MVQNRLIPVLLLKGEGVYKTVKFKQPTYIGDPRNAVKIFNEKEVDEICLLDISASIENRPPAFELIKEITNEAFMPLSYGGGIRSLEHIQRLFSLGIEKVIINSALYDNLDLIKKASEIYGDQSIVASVDVRKNLWGDYKLYSQGGRKKQTEKLLPFLKRVEAMGIGEIILNSIDRDGTMQGMDIPLIREVANVVDVPIVASGGVGNLEHIKEAISQTTVSALGIGSYFLYHGKQKGILITYPSRDELKKINIGL